MGMSGVLLVGMGFLQWLEKKAIRKQKEQQLLIVKEKRSLWKVTGYACIAGVIFFGIQPNVVTVGMACFKLGLLCSIFLLDDMMKTKLYLTDTRVYLVERFRNKRFVHVKEMNTENIYKVTGDSHYGGVYTLYYFGSSNEGLSMRLFIGKQEERNLFKLLLKKRMNITVNQEAKEEKLNEFKESRTKIDTFSHVFIWFSFLTGIGGLVYASKQTVYFLTDTERFVTCFFASLFIPFSLYFFSYFFIITSGVVKKFNVLTLKHMALYLIIASSTIPFYQMLQHGAQSNMEFFNSQLTGLLVFAMISILAFVMGIFVKMWKERKMEKKLKQFS